MSIPLLELRGIVKHYGAVRANDGIDLDVARGEILGLLGENGSGKSTLMKVLFGMEVPDGGGIVLCGRELSGHTPAEAIRRGINMVHQHFMLVEAMTVAENVMIGWPEAGAWLKIAHVDKLIEDAAGRYGLRLKPETLVSDLSLGQRQNVEILKAILRGAELLILDEPTSNLSPPEITGLMGVMRRLREEGKGIIFISHKLGEVIDVCDNVVVLRDGRVAGRTPVAGTTRAALARMMVDRDIAAPAHSRSQADTEPLLAITDLGLNDEHGSPLLSDIALDVRGGEIFGLAGVDGNGQIELVETIAGLRQPSRGRIMVDGRDRTKASVKQRVKCGLSFIPPDRAHTSLVSEMTIAENFALREITRPPYCRGPFLSQAGLRATARRLIERYAVRTSGPDARVRQLSGGNQQKIVVAREVERHPKVLVAFQATWGLDPGATRFVLDQILALREAGAAILYLSTELEELLSIADRIGVLFRGRLVGVMDRNEVDLQQIGLMMASGSASSDRLAA